MLSDVKDDRGKKFDSTIILHTHIHTHRLHSARGNLNALYKHMLHCPICGMEYIGCWYCHGASTCIPGTANAYLNFFSFAAHVPSEYASHTTTREIIFFQKKIMEG